MGWLAAYQYFKLPPAIPLLLERYHYDRVYAGTLMAVFACAGLLLSPWVGNRVMSPAFRGLLMTALALSAAGCLLSLTAPASLAVMMGGRLAEALGFAVFGVVGPLLVTEASSPKDRPLVTGLFATWMPVGQLAAAAVAAPTLDQGHWQSLWWLGLAVIAGMSFWAWRLAPQLGAGWPATSVSAEGAARGRDTERQRSRSAWLAGILFGLWSGQYIAFMTWLPQFLTEDWQLNLRQIATSYAIVPATVIAFNVVAGWLMRRGVGLMTILIPALVAQTGIWLLLPSIDSTGPGLLTLFGYGLLSGLIPTCLFSLPAAISGTPTGRARAFGVMLSGRNLGALVGPVLLPAVLRVAGDDWNRVPWVFGLWMGAAVAVALALAKSIRR